MAHTICYKGHGMWNGDCKPVVWAFRAGYFNEYLKVHPGFLLDSPQSEEEYGLQIFDCTDESPKEDLDCWYCDECGCLAVFFLNYRIDFIPFENKDITFEDIENWEEYIACRNEEFEQFQDFYVGKNPLEAIDEFPFKCRYMLSPEGDYIFGYDKNHRIVIGFKKERVLLINDK